MKIIFCLFRPFIFCGKYAVIYKFIPQLFMRLFNRKKTYFMPHIVSDGIFKQTYGRVWFVQAYGHKYQKVQMLIQQIELKNVSKYFWLSPVYPYISMCFFYIWWNISISKFLFPPMLSFKFRSFFLALVHTYHSSEKKSQLHDNGRNLINFILISVCFGMLWPIRYWLSLIFAMGCVSHCGMCFHRFYAHQTW